MMNKIVDLFIKFDKFGRKANLYYEGNKERTSLIGSIFTKIYIFIYFLFILYKGIRMYKKLDVVFYDIFAYKEKAPSINLTKDNFYVGFALEVPDTYDAFIDETIYYPKAYFKEGKRRKDGKWQWDQKDVKLKNLENLFNQNLKHMI